MLRRDWNGRSRRLPSSAAVLLLAAFIATGCGEAGIDDDAICRVGELAVTKDRFAQAFSAASGQTKARTGAAPKGDDRDDLRRQVAAELVQNAAWRSLADDMDLDVSDKDVDAAVDELVKTGFAGDDKRLKAQLKVEGRTMAQLRADLRDQLYVEAVTDEVRSDVKVDDAAAKAWLADHPSDFGGTPERRTVQHVLIRAGGKAGAVDDAAAKAFAQRTYEKLKESDEAEFAAVAKRFSDDPSFGPTGGTLEYERGTIDDAFEQVAMASDVDEVSEPVKTPLGWHIIVPRSEPTVADVPSFEDVEKQVRAAAKTAEEEAAILTTQEDVSRLVKDAECRGAYKPKPVSSTLPKTKASTGEPAPGTTKPAPDPRTATP